MTEANRQGLEADLRTPEAAIVSNWPHCDVAQEVFHRQQAMADELSEYQPTRVERPGSGTRRSAQPIFSYANAPSWPNLALVIYL